MHNRNEIFSSLPQPEFIQLFIGITFISLLKTFHKPIILLRPVWAIASLMIYLVLQISTLILNHVFTLSSCVSLTKEVIATCKQAQNAIGMEICHGDTWQAGVPSQWGMFCNKKCKSFVSKPCNLHYTESPPTHLQSVVIVRWGRFMQKHWAIIYVISMTQPLIWMHHWILSHTTCII